MGDARPPRELVVGALRMAPVWEADARAYTEVQQASHDHLARFEGWAQARPTEGASRSWFQLCRQGWDAGQRYVYASYDADLDDPTDGTPPRPVGSAGLHALPGRPDGFSIGYWTVAPSCRRGFATLGTAALTWAAFQLEDIDTIEVHCDAANAVSARIPRRLGFELVGTRSRALTAPAQLGRDLVFACTRKLFPTTYACRLWEAQRRLP